MMAAHVITLGLGAGMDQDIQAWFRQFNYMPPLPLMAARVDTHEGNHAFEHLLALVAASPHQRFILMAHGHEDGSGLLARVQDDGRALPGRRLDASQVPSAHGGRS